MMLLPPPARMLLLLLLLLILTLVAYRKCQTSDVFCNAPGGLAPSDGSRLSGPCVPKEKRCDGYLDCRNGRDEEACSGISCRLDQFRCANGLKCIDAAFKCNHKDDCGDKSDEQGCSKYRRCTLMHTAMFGKSLYYRI